MRSSIALLVAALSINTNAARRIEVGHESLGVAEQPAVRSDLPKCPCSIWRHCTPEDVLPEDGGGDDGRGDGIGVACVASADAVISMGHQVQCVPPRNGGVNYYCPPILSYKCDPSAECLHTELASCLDSDCARPDWLPKERHAAFCAMEDCTHAECCDRGPITITEAPEGPAAPESLSTCSERVNALAEATMARIVAYQSECDFNAGHVDFGGHVDYTDGQFDLTPEGRSKLWEEHCQHVAVLQDSPLDVFSDAQALQVECPDHRRLRAQLSSVGIFATAQVLDHFWRACRDAGLGSCAPPRTTTTRAPRPWEEGSDFRMRLTTLPTTTAAPTEAAASCIGTFTFTVQLSNGNEQYEQSLTVHDAAEGAEEHLQCDAGPLIYGSVNMKCQDANWVMSNHGMPCFDNEEEARQAAERDAREGGYVPIHTTTLVDVTAIVTRLLDNEDSTIKCCCNAQLDEHLWANSLIHGRWNAREHTGQCTVHENIRSCSRTDSETHSFERTEGAQCIVNDDDKADWERILQLNRPAGPRFVQPDVPTVSSQEAEDYRDCVPAHSIGQCERCTHNVQCAEGWFCCPFLKMCVEDALTQCPSSMIAACSNCFERFKPNPEQCESHCDNSAFPRTWLPACSSGGWFR